MKNKILLYTSLSALSSVAPSICITQNVKTTNGLYKQSIINGKKNNYKAIDDVKYRLMSKLIHNNYIGSTGSKPWTPWPSIVDDFDNSWGKKFSLKDKDPYFRSYYDKLVKMNFKWIPRSTNQKISNDLSSSLNMKMLIDLGLALASIVTDAVGLPTEEITAGAFLDLFSIASEINSLGQNIKAIIGHSGHRYDIKDILKCKNTVNTIKRALKKGKGSVNTFFSNNYSSHPNPFIPVDLSAIEHNLSFVTGYDVSDTSKININSTYTYHTGECLGTKDPYTGHTRYSWLWDHKFRSAGFTINQNQIQNAFLKTGVSQKNYVLEAADNLKDTDGWLYFSPSTLKSYDNNNISNNQIRTHLYTQPAVRWNTNKKNGMYNTLINQNTAHFHNESYKCEITPSIFASALNNASDETGGESYYSYSKDHDSINGFNNMGNIDIIIPTKTTMKNYPHIDKKDKLFSPVKGEYSEMISMLGGDKNRNPDISNNHIYGDSLIPNGHGGLPILNTSLIKSPDYDVWGSDFIGQHAYDIPVAFKVVNLVNMGLSDLTKIYY